MPSDQLSFDSVTGDQLAREGMAKADSADRVQLWKQDAARWFATVPVGAEFTADDLTKAIGVPDEGANRNNVVGAFFSGLARNQRIRFAGRMRKSARVTRHSNVQRVWIKR